MAMECDFCGRGLFSYYDQHNITTYKIGDKAYTACSSCATKFPSDEAAEKEINRISSQKAQENADQERFENMIVTTTFSIDGHTVKEYKGIVGSQVMSGINMFKDTFAAFRNIVGGRSKSMQESMRRMRDQALAELREEAFLKGANAVIGVKVDVNEYSENMLMLMATGTAVIL